MKPAQFEIDNVYAAPVSEAKAQGVVMPEREECEEERKHPNSWTDHAIGWNACLDAVARLNAAPVQQDGDGMCNEGNPADRCICREEFGHRVCVTATVKQVSVPQCVFDWFEAKQAHVNAVDAYNARLAFVREHMPFGTSVDPEYQIMEAADRKARSLIGPMFSGLRALLSAPAAPAADAWIPVSERLPEVESRLDQECRAGTLSIAPLNVSAAVLVFDGEKVRSTRLEWFDGCLPLPYCITHWMPLPAAPAAHSAKGVV